MSTTDSKVIHKNVREHYGRLAESSLQPPEIACCTDTVGADCCSNVTFYDVDTTWLPTDVTDFSMGCGDPIALAALQPGHTVLDLGSGGGLDCFLAAERVGGQGQVIGVDMTPAMIAKANRNKEKLALKNVSFRLGQIEALPVESATVDVIISNCVINLSPDKEAVFREAFRVLKPGGRLAVSDIVTENHFTPEERANMDAWAACVSGAETATDTVAALKAAGFVNISLRDKANPEVELAGAAFNPGQARPFSARITAEKPRQ